MFLNLAIVNVKQGIRNPPNLTLNFRARRYTSGPRSRCVYQRSARISGCYCNRVRLQVESKVLEAELSINANGLSRVVGVDIFEQAYRIDSVVNETDPCIARPFSRVQADIYSRNLRDSSCRFQTRLRNDSLPSIRQYLTEIRYFIIHMLNSFCLMSISGPNSVKIIKSSFYYVKSIISYAQKRVSHRDTPYIVPTQVLLSAASLNPGLQVSCRCWVGLAQNLLP